MVVSASMRHSLIWVTPWPMGTQHSQSSMAVVLSVAVMTMMMDPALPAVGLVEILMDLRDGRLSDARAQFPMPLMTPASIDLDLLLTLPHDVDNSPHDTGVDDFEQLLSDIIDGGPVT